MRSLIKNYSDKGFNYLTEHVNLDSAKHYLTTAIDLQLTADNYPIDHRVANNYILLASYYRQVYDFTEAIRCYSEAEKILKEYSPDHVYFGTLYHNKGNVYKNRYDLYKTKEYYEYSLTFYEKNGFEKTKGYAFVFSNYINLLIEMEQYQLAKQRLNEIDINSLQIDPLVKFRIYNTNAESYALVAKEELLSGNYDVSDHYYKQAEYYYNIAEEMLVEYPDIYNNTREVMNFYYDRIDFHISRAEFEKAKSECTEAITFINYLSIHSVTATKIFKSDIDLRRAQIYYNMGDLEMALSIVESSIASLQNLLKRISNDNSNSHSSTELTTSLPDFYAIESILLYEKYLLTKEEEDLIASFKSYENTIKSFNFMKLSMSIEGSKIFASSQILDTYYDAIYLGMLLYEKTNDPIYLEKAFLFTETSKSFALYSEIKKIEAMEFSDVDENLKTREKELTGEKQAYENLLYDEQMSEEPNDTLIAIYKDKLFHLNDDYDDLVLEIEQKNAKYYDLKYKPKFVTLEEVQDKLAYREALIEYVLSDTTLITYVIDKKGINVFSQEIDENFAQECMEYYELLHDQNFTEGVRQNYKRFVELSQEFYEILVEPCLEYTDKKNITIVPDGAITYLPFEAFLNGEADKNNINYLNLPYLIRDYSIGYSHSSTLLFNERTTSDVIKERVLAFAPSYENPLRDMDTAEFRDILEGEEYLMPLVGTIKEVQSIKEIVPSDVYINETATEERFKALAPNYNILHLAMHTMMRDDDPLNSMMAFTTMDTSSQDENDNRLYAYEIYSLPLNAQMAVLSSCNSGFGKMQRGEGMMSLARGFIYSGCPSIVMTLWQVADKSSSELITSFYKYLKKGKSKHESMRLAKLEYLEHADDLTSNPYFWSGFVVLGDNSPIYKKNGYIWWMLVVIGFMGGLLYIQFQRRKKGL